MEALLDADALAELLAEPDDDPDDGESAPVHRHSVAHAKPSRWSILFLETPAALAA